LNRYACRLHGCGNHWIAADAGRRVASFTSLAPGLHTLQVRGAGQDGLRTVFPPLFNAAPRPPSWIRAKAQENLRMQAKPVKRYEPGTPIGCPAAARAPWP